jgi:hypothetical protein
VFIDFGFAKTLFAKSSFAQTGLPNPTLGNLLCQIRLWVNRLSRLWLHKNLLCQIRLCTNRVYRILLCEIGFTKSSFAKLCLPNPALRKPASPTLASQKTLFAQFGFVQTGLPNPTLRNRVCRIQLCINWVTDSGFVKTFIPKSEFAYIKFTLSNFVGNCNPLTFCGRFQQIIKVGRKGPEAPTTGHPSSKPPHEVWQHPVGYANEMLDAWSTLLEYDGDPSFFLANSIFFKNVPTGFFPFFTPYVEK